MSHSGALCSHLGMTHRTQQILLVVLGLSASHLSMYGTADKIGNVVTLGGTALIAAALLAVGRGFGTSSRKEAI
jgi:hypothetical protein